MMRTTLKNTLDYCKQILRFEERQSWLRRTLADEKEKMSLEIDRL